MMKDHELPQQPRERTSKERERYEREKADDEARYQHYLDGVVRGISLGRRCSRVIDLRRRRFHAIQSGRRRGFA